MHWRECPAGLTHPIIAAPDQPSLPQAAKTAGKKKILIKKNSIVFPSLPPAEERGDQRSAVGVSRSAPCTGANVLRR